MRGLPLCSLLFSAALLAPAQEFQEFQKKVSDFTLPNGMHFIVLERHESPVVWFHTLVNVGSINDPGGQSGISHMFEHLAYKGTQTIGTRNWPEEKKALDAIEAAYENAQAEASKGDAMRADVARNQLRLAIDNALRFADSGEYRRIMEDNGGSDLAATASVSSTQFSCTLPSNRAELWFLMESQRLIHPIFRDFYVERAIVAEEYRQGVDGNPQAKLLTELLSAAFKSHPYGRPRSGWPSEIQNLRLAQAQAFFDRYYVPGNITMAIVGDVTGAEAKRLAERYFGPMATKPAQPMVLSDEPAQSGAKTVTLEMATQPFALIGYRRPSQYDKDDVALDLIQILLSQGRSGLLYDELVREKRLAQQAAAVATTPDGRFSNLFAFLLIPAAGHTVEEAQRALEVLLGRLKSTPVDAQLLMRAKTQGRAYVIRRLTSNRELAAMLASQASSYGDWRKLFTALDDLKKLKAEDVQRAANRCFVAAGRTMVYPVSPNQQTAPPAKPAERGPGGAQ